VGGSAGCAQGTEPADPPLVHLLSLHNRMEMIINKTITIVTIVSPPPPVSGTVVGITGVGVLLGVGVLISGVGVLPGSGASLGAGVSISGVGHAGTGVSVCLGIPGGSGDTQSSIMLVLLSTNIIIKMIIPFPSF